MKSVKAKISTAIIIALVIACVSPAHAMAPAPKKMAFVTFAPKTYAKVLLKKKGLNNYQFSCLDYIWTKESHWNPKAKNSKSTAFGIGQLLTETSYNPAIQIRNGIRYIQNRYGTPCNAKYFWQRHYWY